MYKQNYVKIIQMQLSNHSLASSNYFIHICINNIQIRHSSNFQDIYFSFIHRGKFHFSSALNSNTSYINDDIFIYFQHEDELPDMLKIQRWENHMILLEHEIDISELKSRFVTKKKLETKHNQIISLTISLHSRSEIKFLDYPVRDIVQQYVKIFEVSIQDRSKQNDNQLTYLQIVTKQQKYIIPVLNSEVMIQLPAEFQISYYKNNKLFGKSDWRSLPQLSSKTLQIGLFNQRGSKACQVKINLQWGTNISSRKLQSSILYEAHQLCIYDIEVKFDNFLQFTGAKLKFVYGSKAFEIIGEFGQRIVQFQRIIYAILKTQDEEVSVYCQKKNKIVAETKFNTTQMLSHKVVTVKKYFTDPVSHRPLGYIRFLCEKAKNLSLPSSNTFWKQFTKKKHPSKLILRIEQLSVQSPSLKNLAAVIKTEKLNYQINSITNISRFQSQSGIHEPLMITIPQKSSIYILIKQKSEESEKQQKDFLGIAAINYEQLRLGSNPVKFSFFKNQQQTLQANCIINKIVPYPFIKGTFQPQITVSPRMKTLSICVDILRTEFEPYFYTFEYERKTEVYCIFEVEKLKKVIVLQPSSDNSLVYVVANDSDALNFAVYETDNLRAKLTFLVSSYGKDEQVYGWTVMKVKMTDFSQNPVIKLDNLQIKNQHGIFIGFISLQIKKGTVNSSQMLSNREIKKIKNEMVRVNDNIEKVQRSFSKNKSMLAESIKTPVIQRKGQSKQKKQLPVRYVNQKRQKTQGVKLPKI